MARESKGYIHVKIIFFLFYKCGKLKLMKRVLFSFISIISISLLFSCASTKSENKSITESDIDKQITEELVEEVPPIPHFIDWKYKGFGHEIPESAEKILKLINDSSEENLLPADNGIVVDIEGNQFIKGITTFASGIDADQAMNVLSSSLDVNLEKFKQNHPEVKISELEIYEDYWFELNPDYQISEKPYIAVRLYNVIVEKNDSEKSYYFKYIAY